MAPRNGTPEDPVVHAVDLERVFDARGGPVRALGPISFTASRGEFLAFVGPSGCGKTTLLRLVGDLLAPTGGRVRVMGGSARAARLARAYGVVFQRPVLYEWRTVANNVGLPLEIAGLDAGERARRINESLSLVGLAGREDAMPWELSGGMQQRVALARAMSMRPRLLLMDEPFAALDEITRERLNLELLRIWGETDVTVLFVTHDIEEAVFLADRIIVLTHAPGRTAATHTVHVPRPRGDDTRTSGAFVAQVDEVRQALRRGPGGRERSV